MAKEVGSHNAQVIWFGDNQAQLNFLGRIRHIEQASDQAELAELLSSTSEAFVIYPVSKVRRSVESPKPGAREITATDQDRAREVAAHLLIHADQHVGELVYLYTRNRELYTEDYYLFRITRR